MYSCLETFPAELKPSARFPHAQALAQVFCLAADAQYDQALAQLDSLETSLQNSKAEDASEYKNMPLYKLLIQVRRGDKKDGLQVLFDSFVARQGGDFVAACHLLFKAFPAYVSTNPEGLRCLDELACLALQNEQMQNLDVQNSFTEEEMACLYNYWQLGLAWSGDWQKAEQICLIGIEKFFPQTPSGANMAKCYACFLFQHRNYDEASVLFKNILDIAPYDIVTPTSDYYLAWHLGGQNRFDEAILLLNNCIEHINQSSDFNLISRKTKAVNLKAHFEEIKRYGSNQEYRRARAQKLLHK